MTAVVAPRSPLPVIVFRDKTNNNQHITCYDIQGEIGCGSSGSVFAAREKTTRKRVALKRIKREFFEKFHSLVKQEFDFGRTFKHSNIIKVHGVCVDEGLPVLIMERARCSLFDLLDGKPLSLLRPILQVATYHVLRALQQIHSRDIVHCDIKVENILVGYDGFFKVADFGFAQTVGQFNKIPLAGTPQYMAPECFVGKGEFTTKFDIWSVGVLVFACLVGEFPKQVDFSSTEKICRTLATVAKQGYINYSSQIGELSIDDVAFLGAIMVVNPSQRPTAADCFKLPWLPARLGHPLPKKTQKKKRREKQ